MISLDTNVLVRYFAEDDETQLKKIHRLLERENATFFVCDIVLVETDWVLRSLYDWSRAEVAEAFTRLTTIHNLEFENESRFRIALGMVEEGADFADEMILGASRERGSDSFATFDKGIIRRHKGIAISP